MVTKLTRLFHSFSMNISRFVLRINFIEPSNWHVFYYNKNCVGGIFFRNCTLHSQHSIAFPLQLLIYRKWILRSWQVVSEVSPKTSSTALDGEIIWIFLRLMENNWVSKLKAINSQNIERWSQFLENSCLIQIRCKFFAYF